MHMAKFINTNITPQFEHLTKIFSETPGNKVDIYNLSYFNSQQVKNLADFVYNKMVVNKYSREDVIFLFPKFKNEHF